MGESTGIAVAVFIQAPSRRPNALEAMEQASHALRHRRKLPAKGQKPQFPIQGRVAANAVAATPSAPRASRALLHDEPLKTPPSIRSTSTNLQKYSPLAGFLAELIAPGPHLDRTCTGPEAYLDRTCSVPDGPLVVGRK